MHSTIFSNPFHALQSLGNIWGHRESNAPPHSLPKSGGRQYLVSLSPPVIPGFERTLASGGSISFENLEIFCRGFAQYVQSHDPHGKPARRLCEEMRTLPQRMIDEADTHQFRTGRACPAYQITARVRREFGRASGQAGAIAGRLERFRPAQQPACDFWRHTQHLLDECSHALLAETGASEHVGWGAEHAEKFQRLAGDKALGFGTSLIDREGLRVTVSGQPFTVPATRISAGAALGYAATEELIADADTKFVVTRRRQLDGQLFAGATLFRRVLPASASAQVGVTAETAAVHKHAQLGTALAAASLHRADTRLIPRGDTGGAAGVHRWAHHTMNGLNQPTRGAKLFDHSKAPVGVTTHRMARGDGSNARIQQAAQLMSRSDNPVAAAWQDSVAQFWPTTAQRTAALLPLRLERLDRDAMAAVFTKPPVPQSAPRPRGTTHSTLAGPSKHGYKAVSVEGKLGFGFDPTSKKQSDDQSSAINYGDRFIPAPTLAAELKLSGKYQANDAESGKWPHENTVGDTGGFQQGFRTLGVAQAALNRRMAQLGGPPQASHPYLDMFERHDPLRRIGLHDKPCEWQGCEHPHDAAYGGRDPIPPRFQHLITALRRGQVSSEAVLAATRDSLQDIYADALQLVLLASPAALGSQSPEGRKAISDINRTAFAGRYGLPNPPSQADVALMLRIAKDSLSHSFLNTSMAISTTKFEQNLRHASPTRRPSDTEAARFQRQSDQLAQPHADLRALLDRLELGGPQAYDRLVSFPGRASKTTKTASVSVWGSANLIQRVLPWFGTTGTDVGGTVAVAFEHPHSQFDELKRFNAITLKLTGSLGTTPDGVRRAVRQALASSCRFTSRERADLLAAWNALDAQDLSAVTQLRSSPRGMQALAQLWNALKALDVSRLTSVHDEAVEFSFAQPITASGEPAAYRKAGMTATHSQRSTALPLSVTTPALPTALPVNVQLASLVSSTRTIGDRHVVSSGPLAALQYPHHAPLLWAPDGRLRTAAQIRLSYLQNPKLLAQLFSHTDPLMGTLDDAWQAHWNARYARGDNVGWRHPANHLQVFADNQDHRHDGAAVYDRASAQLQASSRAQVSAPADVSDQLATLFERAAALPVLSDAERSRRRGLTALERLNLYLSPEEMPRLALAAQILRTVSEINTRAKPTIGYGVASTRLAQMPITAPDGSLLKPVSRFWPPRRTASAEAAVPPRPRTPLPIEQASWL
ncbi:MAG: hypothetical protein JWP52_1416 [Rhizobacter sp.]|nr:hypothetical protein [Rhizobacter sp.]